MKRSFLLFVILIATIISYSQTAELKLNLNPGSKFSHTTIAKSNITETINGQTIDINIGITGTMSYSVVSKKGDDYNMNVQYEEMAMEMELPQGKMNFNAAKKDAKDILSSVMAKILKVPFQITMNQYGKIIEIKNTDKIFDSAINYFTQIPLQQRAQVKQQLSKAFGDEALRGSIEIITAIFPNKPVAKGESWTIHTKLEAGMAADLTSIYTLSEINDDYYVIKGKATAKTADKDSYIEVNGSSVKYDLTGATITEIKVDRETGWIISADMNQELKGDAILKPSDRFPNGLKMPMVARNTTKMGGKRL